MAQQKFAVAYVEALTEGALPIRFGDLAERAGASGWSVSQWRNQTPGFNDWLADQLRAYVGQHWPAVKAVALRFALRGSIEHMKFLRDLLEPAPLRGYTPIGGGAAAVAFGGPVVINLPVPPSELHGHPVVMGLLEAAAAATASPGALGG